MNKPGDRPPPPVASGPLRWLYGALAMLCIVLAVIGVILPGMPTTVFVIGAAWAATRSSPRLHAWLLAHRIFGPSLRNWEDGGRMTRRAKWAATIAMSGGAAVICWTIRPVWAAGALIAVMACVLAWLWRRPEPEVAPPPG